MAEGQYKFSIRLDNEHLEQDVRRAAKQYEKLVEAAKKAGLQIDDSLKNPFDSLIPPSGLPQKTTAVTQSFNGLNMATQQLVRELPAATMGLDTYFLAISNNLPIFVDQIEQMNAANKKLRAQGKPTVGVFKQIIKTLFSWQTALIAGVTFLSMYGKEIGNWVASLFKGKKAMDSMAEAQKGLSEAIQKDGLGIGENIVKLQQLSREYRSLGDNMNARKQFILDNKSAFDDLGVSINSVVDADRLLIERTPEFIQAMMLRAQASAAQKLAEEQYEKAMRLELGISNDKERYDKMSDTAVYGTVAMGEYQGYNNTTVESFNKEKYELGQSIAAREKEAAAIRSVADAYFNLGEAYTAQANSQMKAAGIAPSGGSGGTSGSSAAANAAEAERKRLKEMQEQLAKDAEDARTDTTIAAMAEGLEKEKAAINANYDEKAQLINEREAELKKMQKGKLTEQQVADFQALRDRNEQLRNEEISEAEEAAKNAKTAEDAKTAAAEQSWNEYLIAYGTFQERLKATQDKYATEIANAKNDGEKKMLEAERDAILAEFAVEAEGFGKELVGKTTEELSTMIEQLRAQVEAKQEAFDALDSSDSTSAQAYREEINKLNAQIKVLQGLLGKAKKEVKDDNWADATQVFQNISQAANNAAEGLAEVDEGAANILRTMGQLAGSAINLIGAIQAVETAATAATGTISAMEKASVILAVIGAAIQAVSVLISLFKGSDEVEQTMRQFKELNDELERFRKLAQIDSVEGTIFGENPFGNFQNNLRVMREALSELNATSEQLGRSVWTENFYRGNHILVENLGDALANLQVKTRDRSDFAEFFGATDEYSNLATLYPELFAGGEVSLEGLKNLKNSDVWEKLSQRNRDLIDELIADWERYEKATEAVTAYLTDIFGDLGATITDSLVDAFANGTDAAIAMGDAVSGVIEKIATDMAHAAFIQPLLEEAQAGIEALNKKRAGGMNDEEYMSQLLDITDKLLDDSITQSEDLNLFLENLRRSAEERGYEPFGGDARQGSTKGIAQASQDSVDELNGRMTAIQSHTSMLVDGQKRLIADSTQVLKHLAGIESNTAHLEQMRYDMSAMHKDMSAMRKDINNIALRGVKAI